MSINAIPSPAAVAVAAARGAMTGLRGVEAWSLGNGDLVRATEDVYRLVSVVNGEALRLLGELESRGLAPDAGAPTSAAWLTANLRMRVGTARRQVALAKALAGRDAQWRRSLLGR